MLLLLFNGIILQNYFARDGCFIGRDKQKSEGKHDTMEKSEDFCLSLTGHFFTVLSPCDDEPEPVSQQLFFEEELWLGFKIAGIEKKFRTNIFSQN